MLPIECFLALPKPLKTPKIVFPDPGLALIFPAIFPGSLRPFAIIIGESLCPHQPLCLRLVAPEHRGTILK